jgi:hypothetical protein
MLAPAWLGIRDSIRSGKTAVDDADQHLHEGVPFVRRQGSQQLILPASHHRGDALVQSIATFCQPELGDTPVGVADAPYKQSLGFQLVDEQAGIGAIDDNGKTGVRSKSAKGVFAALTAGPRSMLKSLKAVANAPLRIVRGAVREARDDVRDAGRYALRVCAPLHRRPS